MQKDGERKRTEMGQGRQSVRIRQQEEEQEECFKVINEEEQGWLRKAVGIGCSKQSKNTVQLRAALGPEAKAGWLAEEGGGRCGRRGRGRAERAASPYKSFTNLVTQTGLRLSAGLSPTHQCPGLILQSQALEHDGDG